MKRRNFITGLLGLFGMGTAAKIVEASAPPFNAGSMAYSMMGNPTLEEAIRQRDHWVKCAAEFHNNQMYYRELVVKCGEAIGPAAYIQDDGGVVDEPLVAKVPELVRELVKENQRATASYRNRNTHLS